MEIYNTDKEVAQAVRNRFVKKVFARRHAAAFAVLPRVRARSHIPLAAFASQYNGVWHCMVGVNFGAYSTYEEKHFCYFYTGQTAVLLFKTG